MQYYDPIDLSDKKLRKLAKEIGPAWVRVSGTWSTKTYYDFDGHTNGVIPEGYNAILTREQWLGVLDFCKDIGAKLLISVADCEGLHHADEPWNPSQAEQIFALSKEYGKAIDAAEFVNEPNLLAMSGCPKGYTAEQYVRDQDIFIRWLHENYPDCPFVGPCSTEGVLKKHGEKAQGGGVGDILPQCSTDDLMKGAQEKLDVYSYHYYNGVSERLEPVMPFGKPTRHTPKSIWRLLPTWQSSTLKSGTSTAPAARCGSPKQETRAAAATLGLLPIWMSSAP